MVSIFIVSYLYKLVNWYFRFWQSLIQHYSDSKKTPSTTQTWKTSANVPTTAPSAASSTTRLAAIPESTAASYSSAAPSAATLPTPSTVSAPCLIGYLQNVSSNMISSKGSEYFSFTVQKHDSSVKAVCFSPKKHKQQVESKAESCSPCKLTKFVPHPSEKDVIWVNKNTEIDDARDTEVNFSFRKIENETAALTTTKDVAEIKVNQIVTIHGLLLFGEKKPEQVPRRPNLTKLETSLVDDHGSIPVTLWNEQINTARDGQHYEIQNIRVRQYITAKSTCPPLPKPSYYLPNINLVNCSHKPFKKRRRLLNVNYKKLKFSATKCSPLKSWSISPASVARKRFNHAKSHQCSSVPTATAIFWKTEARRPQQQEFLLMEMVKLHGTHCSHPVSKQS